ncbi:MAG TPA: nuclease-related domain-containing protein [Solirubrobacterales bacterium]|nr:nuclease-related domain-containing protein [Solirubrobacterales bacterium]
MSSGVERRRRAGQHAREQARARSWLRFFGGSFKRSFSTWSQGAEGEEVVGQLLEELATSGWYALHDVSFGRGNIDHVVVGPGGLFTIETKSHRGKVFISSLDQKMLGQAYAEKKTLETVTGMPVRSLLVFSQAYLVGRVPAYSRGVTILPARMLTGFLSRQKQAMSAEEAAAIYGRLAPAVGQAVV